MNWQPIKEIIISKTMEKIQSSRTSIEKSMRNSTKEKSQSDSEKLSKLSLELT